MVEMASIIDSNPEEWIAILPGYQRALVDELIRNGATPYELPRMWLEAGSAVQTAPFGGRSTPKIFYDKFLDELHDLLCSSERYRAERTELANVLGGGRPAGVAFVSTALANTLPASTAYLQPVVAVALFAIATMGLSAWCKTQSERRGDESARLGNHDE